MSSGLTANYGVKLNFMKKLFATTVVLFFGLSTAPSKAQNTMGQKIVGVVAVNPVIDLPRTKAVPVLVQVEGFNGATVPDKVYLEASKGSWNDTQKSFIPLSLSFGLGRAVLNLWTSAIGEKAVDHYSANRINLYLDEEKHILLKSVELISRQQELIRLVSVEGAVRKVNADDKTERWITRQNQKQPVQIRFRIEDESGRGIAGVPCLVDRSAPFPQDEGSPRFSSALTDQNGEVVIPVVTRGKAGTIIYQVLTEYLTSTQAIVEVQK